MSTKNISISEESRVLGEVKPKIDSLILEISKQISKDESLEDYFNGKI